MVLVTLGSSPFSVLKLIVSSGHTSSFGAKAVTTSIPSIAYKQHVVFSSLLSGAGSQIIQHLRDLKPSARSEYSASVLASAKVGMVMLMVVCCTTVVGCWSSTVVFNRSSSRSDCSNSRSLSRQPAFYAIAPCQISNLHPSSRFLIV